MTTPFNNAEAFLLADLRARAVAPRVNAPESQQRRRPSAPLPPRPTRPPAGCTRAEWHAYRLAEHAYRTRGAS